MSNAKVFISYSHDSPEHSERVLELAWSLRDNGIDVELDQFHNEEIVDWPRWCNERISRELSDFVVCVCTAEYKHRIEGNVPPEKGKGVYWEGSLLESRRRFGPPPRWYDAPHPERSPHPRLAAEFDRRAHRSGERAERLGWGLGNR